MIQQIQVLEQHAEKRATAELLQKWLRHIPAGARAREKLNLEGDNARGAPLLSLMKDTPGAVGQTFVLRIPWDPFYEIAHERLNYPVLAQIEGFRKAVLREYGEDIGDDDKKGADEAVEMAGAMAGY